MRRPPKDLSAISTCRPAVAPELTLNVEQRRLRAAFSYGYSTRSPFGGKPLVRRAGSEAQRCGEVEPACLAAERYYALLAAADLPRRGDQDGRGNLSEQALVDWIDYVLDVCLDQVLFMTGLLDLSAMERRIAAKRGTQYQRMIRCLLDAYVEAQPDNPPGAAGPKRQPRKRTGVPGQ